jgi:hypothetical protein
MKIPQIKNLIACVSQKYSSHGLLLLALCLGFALSGLVRFFLGRIFYVKTTANNVKDIKLGALSIPLTL